MRMREDTTGDADRDSVAVVHAALDAGVTLVDTADMYGNEELVGRTIRGRRDEVVLCSKFGVIWGEGGDWTVRADAAYVREACEASLRRLGVETIDLYYLHTRCEETPIEETVEAMADLVVEGKVRALGLSNVTDEDLRRAHAVHPIMALQEEWSLAQRSVESMVPTLAELGVMLVAHSPTGHGVLHELQGSAAGDSLPAGLRATVDEIAQQRSVAAGQVALAWVHHRTQPWRIPVVPIPGTTSVRHLRANVAAADLTLSSDELNRLDDASER